MKRSEILSQIERIEETILLRQPELAHTFSYPIYGHLAHFVADDPALLEVARLSAGNFSRGEAVPNARPIRLFFSLDPQLPADAVPVDLSSQLEYVLVGQRWAVIAEPWVNASGDMADWSIAAVVSPGAAASPRFLSRYICDNLALHMMMREGDAGHIGHLHASTLFRDGRAVLLAAPHNAGKSTTAMRLMLRGYRLVTDSTTFVRFWDEGVELLGYSIGRLKLRMDLLDEFPLFKARGRAMRFRGEDKMVLDLRAQMPERMLEDAIWPREVVVCHIERTSHATTHAERMTTAHMLDEIWPESIFVGEPEINEGNHIAVSQLLGRARCYRLLLGSHPDHIAEVVDAL